MKEMNDKRTTALLVKINVVSPNMVRFTRFGEDQQKSHFIASGSTFPYSTLQPDSNYAILTQLENGIWSWQEAYKVEVNDVIKHTKLVLLKPRR
jgi:hypothetical protein